MTTVTVPVLATMSLSEIAYFIKREWKKVYFGARPYLDAMTTLRSIEENYMLDSGKSVVLYFLANATSWRGETARAVKAELKKRAGVK